MTGPMGSFVQGAPKPSFRDFGFPGFNDGFDNRGGFDNSRRNEDGFDSIPTVDHGDSWEFEHDEKTESNMAESTDSETKSSDDTTTSSTSTTAAEVK